jgi:putative lipoic acid-binding regulatory protein
MDKLNKTGNMVNLSDIPVAESLIEYPSDFPIKIMGPMHETFTAVIVDVVTQHDPEFHAGR